MLIRRTHVLPPFLSSLPSLFFPSFFLPFLQFFPFPPFSSRFFSFFTFLFKKSFKKFCRCPKSSYLCTRFPQGELMKFFDRLRTHQSYSRLLDSFRGSLEPSRFLYNWIYTDMRQSRIAWPDRHHPFPFPFCGSGIGIHTSLQ